MRFPLLASSGEDMRYEAVRSIDRWRNVAGLALRAIAARCRIGRRTRRSPDVAHHALAGVDAGDAGPPYVLGVPALRSWEIAVTNCAGANGLVSRILFGTPLEAQSSALSPVM